MNSRRKEADGERREVALMAESIADAEAQLWKLGAACVLGMSVKECAAVDKLLAKCQATKSVIDNGEL